jgi:hypothetical protein
MLQRIRGISGIPLVNLKIDKSKYFYFSTNFREIGGNPGDSWKNREIFDGF